MPSSLLLRLQQKKKEEEKRLNNSLAEIVGSELNMVSAGRRVMYTYLFSISVSLPQCKPIVFSVCAYCKPSIVRNLCLLLYHFASKSFNLVGIFCNRIDSNVDHNWFLRHLPLHHSTANHSLLVPTTTITTTFVVTGSRKRPVLPLTRAWHLLHFPSKQLSVEFPCPFQIITRNFEMNYRRHILSNYLSLHAFFC